MQFLLGRKPLFCVFDAVWISDSETGMSSIGIVSMLD